MIYYAISPTLVKLFGGRKTITAQWRRMLDTFVELDDTYLGTSTHGKKRGRGTEKAKIMVAVSKSREGIPMFAKMAVMPNLRGIEVGKGAENGTAAERAEKPAFQQSPGEDLHRASTTVTLLRPPKPTLNDPTAGG